MRREDVERAKTLLARCLTTVYQDNLAQRDGVAAGVVAFQHELQDWKCRPIATAASKPQARWFGLDPCQFIE